MSKSKKTHKLFMLRMESSILFKPLYLRQYCPFPNMHRTLQMESVQNLQDTTCCIMLHETLSLCEFQLHLRQRLWTARPPLWVQQQFRASSASPSDRYQNKARCISHWGRRHGPALQRLSSVPECNSTQTHTQSPIIKVFIGVLCTKSCFGVA